MTDRYCVFGNPIAHSKSPAIHAKFAAASAQNMRYEALLAPLDGFTERVREFMAAGGRGANVTVPFKEEAFRLCDKRSVRAERAGAVNTLVSMRLKFLATILTVQASSAISPVIWGSVSAPSGFCCLAPVVLRAVLLSRCWHSSQPVFLLPIVVLISIGFGRIVFRECYGRRGKYHRNCRQKL
jgi:hypothetical protein